ncbi:unnamed protein product, partial [Mesorhabditis belari]|uniref:adenosine deaminase n=1 Tax=Mesorhabditis belari TaxID=2138241 RepID=A0AAF3FNF5_9BILA
MGASVSNLFAGGEMTQSTGQTNGAAIHEGSATDKSMPPFSAKLTKKFPFPKVELHLHLDGSVRFTTLWDMCNKKDMPVPDVHDVEGLKKAIISTKPGNLSQVLEAFKIILPRIAGDVTVLENIAYETCEDQHRNGVIYFEARYAPHFLANTGPGIDYEHTYHKDGPVTAEDVVQAVYRGFERGKKDFGIEARSILCCIRGHDLWNDDVLALVSKHRHDLGVLMKNMNHRLFVSSRRLPLWEFIVHDHGYRRDAR